jgi:hypothetical protein
MKAAATVLAAMTLSALSICAQTPAKTASAEDVCSFITTKMKAAAPEIPTFCMPAETPSPFEYKLTVFSTTDVLQGKMRRTWSVALFEAAQELFFGNALNGTCESVLKESSNVSRCQLNVSDAYMSQRGERYQIVMPVLDMLKGQLYGDPSSDDWYQMWWYAALLDQTFDHWAGSKRDAEGRANLACRVYLQKIQEDPEVRLLPNDIPVPECSLVLATDFSVYIAIDFPSFSAPGFVNYEEPLDEVFGASFADTPYEGAVVFRSPWKTFNGGNTSRCLWSYGLRELGFHWEELHSGVRGDVLARPEPGGQTDRDSPTPGPSGGAIVKLSTAADGREVADLTNGSEWYLAQLDGNLKSGSVTLPAGTITHRQATLAGMLTGLAGKASQCTLHIGDKVLIIQTGPANTKHAVLLVLGRNCELQATFAGAW